MRFVSLRSRLVGAALLGLSLAMALVGIALESAHSTSIDTARIERQIAELYGLIAEADVFEGRLSLPLELPDPAFNRLGGHRFAGVFDDVGRLVWASTSLTLLDDRWQADLRRLPATVRGKASAIALDLEAAELLGQRMTIRWQTDDLQGDYTFFVLESAEVVLAEVRAFRQRLWLWLSAAVGLVLVMQLLILKWGLAPLARFTRDLERMRAGALAQLPEGEVRELKPLAGLLNQLVTRERAQSERYRQSLADLAHSLKTPVTILRNEWTRRFCVGETQGPASDLEDATLSQLDEIEQRISYQLERAVLQSSPLVQVPIAVEPIVQGLIRAMNKMFHERAVVWDTDLSQNLIRVDPRDLNEILGNLAENAVKYGAQTIRISLGREGDDAVLEVQDDGPGIPLERRAEVMQRGQRADTKAQGYGIGLDIVRQIAERYGAEVQYRTSERLGGASFSIRFEGLAQIPL